MPCPYGFRSPLELFVCWYFWQFSRFTHNLTFWFRWPTKFGHASDHATEFLLSVVGLSVERGPNFR